MDFILRSFLKIDFVSSDLKPIFNLQTKIRTLFGAFLSIFITTIGIFGFVYFGREIYEKKSPSIKSSNEQIEYSQVNLHLKMPTILIRQVSRNVNFHPGLQRAIKVYGVYYEISIDENKQFSIKETTLPMIPCNENLFDADAMTFIKSRGFALNQLLCMDINTPNLSGKQIIVQNNYASIGSKSLHVFVQKCDEKDDPGCADILEKEFDNLILNVSTIDTNLDILNYEHPISFQSVASVVKMNKDFFSYQLISLMTNELISDDGFILGNLSSKTFATRGQVDYQFAPISKVERIMAEVIFQAPKQKFIIQRTYLKVQEVMANVGGFVKVLLLVSTAMCDGYSNYILKCQIQRLFLDKLQEQEQRRISYTIRKRPLSESQIEIQSASSLTEKTRNGNVFNYIAYEYRRLFKKKQDDLEIYLGVIDFKRNFDEILKLKDETIEIREALEG